jgi:hypothetical protein
MRLACLSMNPDADNINALSTGEDFKVMENYLANLLLLY